MNMYIYIYICTLGCRHRLEEEYESEDDVNADDSDHDAKGEHAVIEVAAGGKESDGESTGSDDVDEGLPDDFLDEQSLGIAGHISK